MRDIEVESLALRVAEDLRGGIAPEDSRIELKAAWPDNANRCARRIAGHCNASRGTPVVWLIGLDGDAKAITGMADIEIADWWNEVKAEFEGEVPALREIAIRLPEATIVALMFDSSRAPFVVRNAQYGRSPTAVQYEVPWREGTAVSSATRAQLIRLLLPATAAPTFEVTKATLELTGGQHDGEHRVHLQATVYATVPMGLGTLVYPEHLASAELALSGFGEPIAMEPSLHAHSGGSGGLLGFNQPRDPDERVHTILRGDRQILLTGPGFFRVSGSASIEADESQLASLHRIGEARVEMLAVGEEIPSRFSMELKPADEAGTDDTYKHYRFRWDLSDVVQSETPDTTISPK